MNEEVPFEVLQPVLLTGAGFTRNFGGYLATTMWSIIFNRPEIQRRPLLVTLLKSDFNYESAYAEVMYGNQFSDDDKEAMETAVAAAYGQLDQNVSDFSESIVSVPPVSISRVNNFIKRCGGEEGDNARGYFFTLNQDLFVERFYSGEQSLTIPGIRKTLSIRGRGRQDLQDDDHFTLPTGHTLPQLQKSDADKLSSSGRLHYVKLHGSMNWRGSDGRGAMVIGGNKLEHIDREPLLSWYYQTFRRILSLGDRRLVIIGYGFRDPHINEVIADSIGDRRLKLYVVTPAGPEKFWETLLLTPRGKDIWEGISGYFPYELKDVFSQDWQTPAEREIRTAIFG